MKRKITKVEFDALHEEIKKHYKVDETNADKYILDVEESELLRAKDREKEGREKAEKELLAAKAALKEAEDKLADDEHIAARKSGDIKLIEKSWEKKLEAAKKEGDDKLAAMTSQLAKVLVTEKATVIATAIAGDNAHLLVPAIEKRLKADTSGLEATTRVLDDKGQPSAMSLDELQKEFVANPKFGAIVIGTKGSGGADNVPGRTSRPATVPKDKKFNELTEQQRVDWAKVDPKGFEAAHTEFVASLRKV